MASQQASQSMLERIKRSDLPQSQVYVAEQMKNQDEIGDEDYNPSEIQRKNLRCQPELVGRMKEQEAIVRGVPQEAMTPVNRDAQTPRYTVFMLGSVLGLLLIFALKHNEWIRSILKKIF